MYHLPEYNEFKKPCLILFSYNISSDYMKPISNWMCLTDKPTDPIFIYFRTYKYISDLFKNSTVIEFICLTKLKYDDRYTTLFIFEY